jgi:hypothetical protein
MFVGQQRVFTAPSFFDGSVDNALGGFANFTR